MRGVDRGDQLIELYNAGRRNMKPWCRIFYYLLECCVLNAYVIEGLFDGRHQEKGRKKRDCKQFRMELAVALIDGYSNRKRTGRKRESDEIRLNHSMDHMPVYSAQKRPCRRCCAKGRRLKQEIRHESRTKCEACDVYLCISEGRNCFKEFHSVRKLELFSSLLEIFYLCSDYMSMKLSCSLVVLYGVLCKATHAHIILFCSMAIFWF